MSTPVHEKSPWASINDVLIQNKCWLCLNTFAKERQKLVFEVSDLLTFYHNHRKRSIAAATSQSTEADKTLDKPQDAKFVSENLQRCYESYVALMEAGDGKPDALFEEFKANDVEVWMSGLTCGTTESCKQEAAYFIEAKHATGVKKEKVNEMFSFAIPSGTECPPGCNCEPSWPFMP